MNTWHGIGNIGADPELKTTVSGKSVLNFRMAVDRVRYDAATSTMVKTADWIPVVCWDGAAELNARYLQKGSKVAVIGELRPRSYVDRNGATQQRFEIQATHIEWLDGIRSNAEINAEPVATEATP